MTRHADKSDGMCLFCSQTQKLYGEIFAPGGSQSKSTVLELFR